MTVSRASLSAALTLALAVAAAGPAAGERRVPGSFQSAGQATGQTGAPGGGADAPAGETRPPVRLAPPPKPEGAGAAGEGTGPAPGPQAPGPQPGIEPSVQVDELTDIDPDSVGVLDESQGGFGADMWTGTPRRLVERLLPRLPAKATSREMRDLMRRLLLSNATAPAGPASPPSLIARRVERLSAMGEVSAVNQLLRVTPTRLANKDLHLAQVNSLFLANDHDAACTQVRNHIREYEDAYWQKAFVFCQTLNGEEAQARLGLDLLREESDERDAAFYKLVEALTGANDVMVESLADPSPLHLAMMRTAEQPLPADAAETSDPAILRAIAVSPNADLDLRLDAAERAEAADVLSPDALSQLYESVTFTEEELNNALSTAESKGGPRGRALLHQAAKRQSVPTARAEALQAAWRAAREDGRYGTAVRVNLGLLLELRPKAELMWFAPDAGRALFMAGRIEEAMSWYELAAQTAERNEEAAEARLALWPLVQIADADNVLPWDESMLVRWRHAQTAAGPEGRARAVLLVSLLDSMGEHITPVHWGPLIDEADRSVVPMPVPGIWQGLRGASEELRIGETVMLSLISLGNGGPAAAHPILLGGVISALRFVGLDTEARNLGLEAAVAAGI